MRVSCSLVVHSIIYSSLVLTGATPLSLQAESSDEQESAKFSEVQLEFFEKEVRPLLIKRCYECHSSESEELAGGLLLDSRSAILTGGDSGASIEPGKPAESLIIDAINYGDNEMPPKSKMPKQEIATLTKWVEMGAPWPNEKAPISIHHKQGLDIAKLKSEHWSWNPLAHPEVPKVQNQAWARRDLDQFILAKLEENQMAPNAPADRNTLLRRLSYDLTGLPPTPEEIQAFADDQSDDALEKVVDRLLRSPRFGEQWGRHWLDLMRYAESRGHEFDADTPNAFQYRDYVIRALNADVPYNQFAIEHIAGDMLENPRKNPEEGFNESVLGTGFWFLGEWIHSPVDIRQDEADRFDNMIDVMSKSFLGLTVACARCHDHKFDPIPQADYYAQFGFLQSSAYHQVRFDSLEQNQKVAESFAKLDRDTQQKAAQTVADHLTIDQATIANKLPSWNEQIKLAAKDAKHPLHIWALYTANKEVSAEKATEINQQLKQSYQQKKDASEASWDNVQTVIDYRNLDPINWRSDGFAYGRGLRPANQFLFSEDPANPIQGLSSQTSAVRDARWNELNLSPGTQDDMGKIAKWKRAGRTLRTPTFTLNDGRIHYRVRGAGRVFAVVDSHRLVQGPLHNRVILQWNPDKENQERWITQDLQRYQGHNLHIEFVPFDNHPLEIIAVVEGEKAPTLFESTPSEEFAIQLPSEKKDWNQKQLAVQLASYLLAAISDIQSNTNPSPGNSLRNQWVIENRNRFTPDPDQLNQQLADIANQHKAASEAVKKQAILNSRTAPAIWDGSGVDEFVLIRGNSKNTGELTKRGMLTAIYEDRPDHGQNTSGRLQMAQRMMQPENPFASRVIVNRVWHHLTGRGIVPTVDNFGVLGEKPTHPELLDHLATTFIEEDNWSLKQMIRRIVLSQTYAMSSKPGGKEDELDPNVELLHRMRVRRLTGESIRDGILSVSGRLDTKMYGPGVPVHLTQFMQGRGRPGKSGPIDGAGRRSIYITVRRNFLPPMMLTFDTPIPFTSIGRRTQSNVPAQSLILLNDPFVVEQAKLLGTKIAAEQQTPIDQRIRQLYLKSLSRNPITDEQEAAHEFLISQAKLHGITEDAIASNAAVWGDLVHVLMNTKEFIFIR
ncbi:MAG: PSD1 and planctomycete cytochrome C domain-containing protein [Pirellulales bacterium]